MPPKTDTKQKPGFVEKDIGEAGEIEEGDGAKPKEYSNTDEPSSPAKRPESY